MVKVQSVEEWITKVQRGAEAAGDKWLRNLIQFGLPKLRRYAQLFLAAHQAANYVPMPMTDAERIRNVQTSWNTTRAVVAQYRGRAAGIAGVAAAIPVA